MVSAKMFPSNTCPESFGTLQINIIVFQKKKKQGNVILLVQDFLKTIFWFKFQKIKSKARTKIQRI